MVGLGLWFCDAKVLGEISMVSTQRGRQIHAGRKKLRFSTNNSLYIENGRLQRQHIHIPSVKDKFEVVCTLSTTLSYPSHPKSFVY